MIGVLVIFAPVAIACTIFKVTAPLFDRWVNLALGFAFYPMLSAGMAAFTIYVAEDLTPASMADVETIGDIVSFIVVMMLGTGLMAMVPTIAQSLAQTATGLGGIANSTFRNAGSMQSAGRSSIAGSIGGGRGGAGLDVATTSGTVKAGLTFAFGFCAITLGLGLICLGFGFTCGFSCGIFCGTSTTLGSITLAGFGGAKLTSIACG